MAFETIIPQAKARTGVFKIMSVARQGGAFRLVLSMPSARYTAAFGDAARLTVKIGKGSDAGKLLLVADAEGAFKPTFLKTAVIVRFPELDFAPDFAAVAEDPETRRTADGLVITLPEWAWNEERQKAIRKAREQVARERGAGAGR
ncbi:hypothetical protein [Shinella sp. BYT-45]|uniref:hypothetical protein n=1 Tax=Shinella sp. BYT-45 TaxID=3377377 RepID=UPI00397ECE2E